jgi:hypothetical protein
VTEPTPEAAALIIAALRGEAPAIVCYSRCWSCQFDQHYDPPKPHPWADDEDREHAAATGQPEPTGNCACTCARSAS